MNQTRPFEITCVPRQRIVFSLYNDKGKSLIVNTSELRAAGFDLREVIPLQLEAAARGDRRTRGAALKHNDNEFRSRCE